MSCVAQLTRAEPSRLRVTEALQDMRNAPHEAQAIPQPRILSPLFIEPGAAVRLDQPKRSAPVVMHSRRWREEKGLPLLSSLDGSLRRRRATGSMLRRTASSSMADSRA